MEVEAAGPAVVHEPTHILLAGVAVPWDVPRRPREELERALGVERVCDRRGRDGAVHVEVEVARGAPVAGADPGLLAAVALERELGVPEPEPVPGVAEVGNLSVLHGSAGLLRAL